MKTSDKITTIALASAVGFTAIALASVYLIHRALNGMDTLDIDVSADSALSSLYQRKR